MMGVPDWGAQIMGVPDWGHPIGGKRVETAYEKREIGEGGQF